MTEMPPRGLVIAGPRSGSGKTTVTLGLLRALARQGVRVGSAKCGPDYIDPAFHARATGHRSLNLDTWAMPPAQVRSLAETAAEGCDLVICEGLMGLFDGVPGEPGRTGSSADVAAALGWPVILVHDASGQAQSAAAQIVGCARFDPRIAIAGVILNRVGSERHRRLIASALEPFGLPILGALPKAEHLVLPERHLGLVQAGETEELDARLDAMADFIRAHLDLDRLAAMAKPLGPSLKPDLASVLEDAANLPSPLVGERGTRETDERALQLHRPLIIRRFAPPYPTRGKGTAALPPPGQRIAIAQDAAFSFLYPHVLEGWHRAGANVLFFSPLADEAPPDDCDSCWLPGGYPELHAGTIAAAGRFLNGLRAFAATRPVHGECGGYMALGQSLVDAEGVTHAMAGLLSVRTSFAKRKLNLGYRDAELLADGPLGRKGDRVRGHEFHYATIVSAIGDDPFAHVRDAYGAAPTPAGSRRGTVTGSFFHAMACVAD